MIYSTIDSKQINEIVSLIKIFDLLKFIFIQ